MGGEHISGNWQWIYFERIDRKPTLFIAQQTKDDAVDYFSCVTPRKEERKCKSSSIRLYSRGNDNENA